jgi:hypothetical protein
MEPCYPEEIRAVASRLVQGGGGVRAASAGEALPRLAGEVAHAVNNPLQILSLLGEGSTVEPQTRASLRAEVSRIRDVVGILDRFAGLKEPRRVRTPIGTTLTSSLAAAELTGAIRRVGKAVPEGPEVLADPHQVRAALQSLVEFVVARGDERPLPVAARVRRGAEGDAVFVEAAVRGREVFVPSAEVEALRTCVVVSHEASRQAYPGLALASEVGRLHGGSLVALESGHGTILALRIPA